MRGPSCSCFLGSTATARSSSTATRLVSAARGSVAASSSRSTAGEAAATERLLGALTALLDLELDTVHRVGIGGNGGLVGGRCLEVDECAVLREESVRLMMCEI